jgi:hypothetical protein
MAQEVVSLKCEALSINPSTAHTHKKKVKNLSKVKSRKKKKLILVPGDYKCSSSQKKRIGKNY